MSTDPLEALADAVDGSEACRNDPEMWFSEHANSIETHDAKALCNGTERRYGESVAHECHARQKCFLAGLLYSTHGVWGGTDPEERANIRIKRRLPHPSMGPRGAYDD